MGNFKQHNGARSGITLLILTISIVVGTIALAVVMPGAELQVRRDKEEQLRFALNEIRRASEKFSAQKNRAPASIDELICDENGNRWLRQVYKDPFTGLSQWSFEASGTEAIVHSLSDGLSISGQPYKNF